MRVCLHWWDNKNLNYNWQEWPIAMAYQKFKQLTEEANRIELCSLTDELLLIWEK